MAPSTGRCRERFADRPGWFRRCDAAVGRVNSALTALLGDPAATISHRPQARVTDQCICVGPPDVIVMGSMTVLVTKLPAARIGDLCAHGGTLVMGYPTVLIGG